jgi:tetratricopeptide (TPR) repeat protein
MTLRLADLRAAIGKGKSAESLYLRAHEIWEDCGCRTYPEGDAGLQKLALLHLSRGAYAEAEALFAQSLAIRQAALGSDHVNVGATLGNLATSYFMQKKYAAAEEALWRARDILARTLDPAHQSIATAKAIQEALLRTAKGPPTRRMLGSHALILP